MATVTVLSFIERLFGFIYRVFLSRNLGAEGVGIYQIALSVVGLLITLTASGIPITVSRIMIKNSTENFKDGSGGVVFAGIFLSLALSLPITILMFLFPNAFSFIFTDERCFSALKIILPGVVITSIYAVIRGYFWGQKKFLTYSLIELFEEIVMLVVGIVLILNMKNTLDGVKRASYAVLVSYALSFIVASVFYFLHGGKFASPKNSLKPLIASSAPITAMRTTTSLINTLIAIILPARLVLSGMSNQVALSSFGELSGMSIPLIYIPSTLIGSIALVLVPELAENYYRHNELTLKNNIEQAIKCSVFISSIIIPIFLSMGKEFGVLLYDNSNAGVYVERACIIMFPMSITMITNSVLNSLNLEKHTLFYYLLGALFLMICIFFLPKYIGVYSLVLGLLLSYVTTAILNLNLIKKTCVKKPNFLRFILVSLLFIIPSSLFGYFLKNVLVKFLPSTIALFSSAFLVVLFTYAFYRVFNLFDIRVFFKK
ncbi:MAG: oligosaccharide flippase family protein [Clostridia bacterium]|nr:oligosaccharide flippase family protein [Clostridia bacterium]